MTHTSCPDCFSKKYHIQTGAEKISFLRNRQEKQEPTCGFFFAFFCFSLALFLGTLHSNTHTLKLHSGTAAAPVEVTSALLKGASGISSANAGFELSLDCKLCMLQSLTCKALLKV